VAVHARVRKSGGILPQPPRATASAQLALAVEALTRLELERYSKPGSSFIGFAQDLLKLGLTPAQSAVAGFLFDFTTPPPSQIELLFGGAALAVETARRVALAVCGRGSGKTRILVAARALHLAISVGLDSLAEGEAALVPLVAPDQRQGRQALSFVKGFFAANPVLEAILSVSMTQDTVRLTRLDGKLVSIEVRPASAGGKAVRGASMPAVFMDEAAFFYGEGYEVSDIEIFRAAIPRLLPGGQIVITTTPWAQSGLVWDLFRDNFGHPQNALAARAPTLAMRPSHETEIDYQSACLQDPDNAAREWDAQFLSADAERFFSEALIERSIDKSLSPPLDILTGEKVRFGADFAFSSDSSSLFGLVERDGLFVTSSILEKRPRPNEPLVPSEVVAEFAAEVQRCGARMVVADDHYRESVREHLTKYGLALSPAPSPPAVSYVIVRSLMSQGRIRIPSHPRLLAQLRRVRSTIKPGGVITIHQPRARDGGHGDIVSAMVCALSGVSLTATRPEAAPKTPLEAEVRAEKRAQKERLETNAKRLAQGDRRMSSQLKARFGQQLEALKKWASQ
jgi:hypothetical protein